MLWSVLYEEFLSNHSGDDRLAETHHIGKEKTVVADEFLIAFHHGICLIVVLCITFGHVEGVVIINSQHPLAEILHEHFNVELIWRNIAFQVSLVERFPIIFGIDRYPFGLFPQQFKLVFGKSDVFILG